MFADDTSLTVKGKIIDEIELGLNEDLDNIRLWLQANKRSLNVAKTEYVLIGSRQRLWLWLIQRIRATLSTNQMQN